MKITILGTGSPEGNPVLLSKKSGPNRLRPGLLIEYGEKVILFDTSPDIRQQLIQQKVTKIDAVFLTHSHFDHIWGIADLDQLFWTGKQEYELYANDSTIGYLKKNMSWLRKHPHRVGNIQIGGLQISPFVIKHEDGLEMVGYCIRLGDKKVVYAPDIGGLTKESLDIIKGADVLVADGQYILGKYIEDDSHLGGKELIDLLKKTNSKKVYLVAYSEYWYKKSAKEAMKKLPKTFVIPSDGEVIFL